MSDEYENGVAVYEAERNRAWHSWFAARGHIPPTDEHTLIFDGGFRMAWELFRAQPEPAGYFRNVTGDGDLIQRWGQSEWAEDGAVPLYTHPPADELEALRRDAAIGRMTRLKMASGNRVRVSMCVITAGDIDAAMAQQEAP